MALPPAEQIWWGPGLESVIDFDYPVALDAPRTWRRPAPGSEQVRTPAGVISSWTTGYDYFLAGRARWFDRSRWGGGVGLQAFLDWAGQGNPFRFVPDKTVPDFYVDNCFLDAPFDEIDPQIEEADGSQSIDLVIRNQTKDFGEALRGIMFEYAPGMSLTDPVAATFTRATAATRRGLPGTLVSPVGASDASGVLRDRHYEGTLRTTLLEAQRIQLVPDPENFGAWTAVNVTLLSGQADPFGGTAAYKLTATAGADNRIQQVIAFTGDATKALLGFARADTATESHLKLQGAAIRHQIKLTWTAGVPTLSTDTGSGTLFSVVPWGGGWYAIMFSADGVVAGDSNILSIYPAAASGTGSSYWFGANAWNAPFPSSYQGPALTTRNADSPLSWAHAYRPQSFFALLDFIERGRETTSGLIGVGPTNVSPNWNIDKQSATNYRIAHNNVSGSNVAVTPSVGDRIQLLGLLYPNGDTRLNYSKNLAAEVVSSLTPTAAIASAWSVLTLALQGWSGGLVNGSQAIARVKVGPLTFGGVTVDSIAKALAR